jgi:hypothetical protein
MGQKEPLVSDGGRLGRNPEAVNNRVFARRAKSNYGNAGKNVIVLARWANMYKAREMCQPTLRTNARGQEWKCVHTPISPTNPTTD